MQLENEKLKKKLEIELKQKKELIYQESELSEIINGPKKLEKAYGSSETSDTDVAVTVAADDGWEVLETKRDLSI